jgi:hypothetical protein
MPLTVTTDLVRITDAETATGWTSFVSSGTSNMALEPDFFAQGANCISQNASTGGATKGMTFDIGAANTLDFVTTHAGKLIFIWMRTSAPGVCDTRANGGIQIILGSGATAPGPSAGVWSKWYVDGADTLLATDGWKCYVIDPRLPPSATFGGGVDLTAVRWFGGAQKNAGGKTASGKVFGIDAISYGFGELRVYGTNTTPGKGFKEIADADFGTIANRYGIVTVKEGVIYVQGRLVIGDSTGTNSTNFTSENETLVWNHPTYFDGVRERPSVPDARPDGTPYFGIYRVGNATGVTDFQIGQKVGSGDTASGRSGGTFTGSRIRTEFNGQSGTVKTGSVFGVYGATFIRFRGGFDLTSNVATDEWHGGSIIQSGSFRSGKVKVRNTIFVDNLGGSYKFLEDFQNDGTANETLAVADPRIDWANAVGGSQLVVPAGVEYVRLDSAANVRNVVKINSDIVGSDDHYVDAVIRFPAGSNQGTIGVFIRGDATLANENYWLLLLDRPNSQIRLIRCDAGVDTVISSTSFVLAADTDYQVHLRASGTTIEGFVNGTKLSTTSSTYQTNRRVGIRGTTNASQSSGAEPRVFRFGCGPVTDNLGAVRLSNPTDANVVNCSWINNNRAVSIATTGTYSFTGHSFSGNAVGVRNDSNGAVTINVSSGQTPGSNVENIGSSTTTINAVYDYTLTNLVPGSEVRIFNAATEVELAGTESSGTSFTWQHDGTPLSIYVIIQRVDYEWLRINDSVTTASKSQKIIQRPDRNYTNP